MLFIFIGLAIVSIVLNTLSMGGNPNPEQIEFNSATNKVIGFPVQLFKNGFPLLLSNREFWTIQNLTLVFINTLIQSLGVFYVVKYIKRFK